jgi:hypothetical protein
MLHCELGQTYPLLLLIHTHGLWQKHSDLSKWPWTSLSAGWFLNFPERDWVSYWFSQTGDVRKPDSAMPPHSMNVSIKYSYLCLIIIVTNKNNSFHVLFQAYCRGYLVRQTLKEKSQVSFILTDPKYIILQYYIFI